MSGAAPVALAFDTESAPEYRVTKCDGQRKFFRIQLASKEGTRMLTLNKKADLFIFKGTSAKDLKWTMPLSDFRFYAGAPSGEERMLGAVELHSGRFDFGWIDDGCWKRLRKYGAGAMEFG